MGRSTKVLGVAVPDAREAYTITVTMADKGSSEDRQFPHFGTLAIHAGQEPEQWRSKAVVPPISLSTTFKQDEPGKPVGTVFLSVSRV